MWVLGVVVGVVAFVVGAVVSTLAFLNASGLEAMLPGIVLAALGSLMAFGFLVWGIVFRRRTSDEAR
ncbi:MAG: hypothetical protein ACYCX3_14525 [Thermoleophilia bacterium]